MESLFSRLKQGRIFGFPGGVKPPSRKEQSNQTQIASLPLPSRLYISVKQHIGVEGKVLVSPGEKVLKGQPLTSGTNPFAVPVHAPTSGEVIAIIDHPAAHPSGFAEQTIEIEPDGLGQWTSLSAINDYSKQSKQHIIEAICHAGIAGMGGAGFPTHIKAVSKKPVEYLIVNGVECEPYITSDDRLMREHAWQIRQGIDILHHLLSPGSVVVAIEDNKPEAIKAMKVACQDHPLYTVVTIPTRYPAGGEKQLIQNLLNREVPRNGLPADIGVIMQNVGTCYAIADAILSGKPLIERVVTVTGEAIGKPGNYWVPIGTPVQHLLEQCDYQAAKQQQQRIILGGPMMGFTLHHANTPIVKTANCILAPSDKAMPKAGPEQACIRCAACTEACPASLLPQQLYWYSKSGELERAQQFNLFDCIECGACSYVCPSDIPLVHYYRKAKAEVRLQEHEKQKSDKARVRFEARKERLEQEAEARRLKHQQAAERRKQAMQSEGGQDQSKIAAALARVKAKKQQAASEQNDNTDQDKSKAVSAAVARAKAKKLAQQAQAETEQKRTPESEGRSASSVTSEAGDDKKARVAAAVARAKAKKQAQAEAQQQPKAESDADASTSASSSKDDDKKARVAAAVARAKAKKQAQAQAQQQPKAEPGADASSSASSAKDDDKKARVAAAVARAKAKKQAQTASESAIQSETNQAPLSAEEQKRAKVAAAVARAKAKKARQDEENQS